MNHRSEIMDIILLRSNQFIIYKLPRPPWTTHCHHMAILLLIAMGTISTLATKIMEYVNYLIYIHT